jgi:hypothetical protein
LQFGLAPPLDPYRGQHVPEKCICVCASPASIRNHQKCHHLPRTSCSPVARVRRAASLTPVAADQHRQRRVRVGIRDGAFTSARLSLRAPGAHEPPPKTDDSFHGRTIQIAELPPGLNSQCSSALDFLDWAARLVCVGSGGRHAATVQIILPAQDGCIVRADILRQRLAISKSIERVEEFVSLDQHMIAFQESQGASTDLLNILSYAAGAILELQHIQSSPSVNQELQAKLSFSWICQLPRAQHFRCNANNYQVLLHGLRNGWSSSTAGLKSSWRSG